MARDTSIEVRAARHGALGDPIRLAIVEELIRSDRSPVELRRLTGVESNLLAHHLDVLERVGLIARRRSSGDARRRYVHLHREALDGLTPRGVRRAEPALFVCTHNSARSPLAAAMWTQLTDQPADSAGTHPAHRVHPGAVRAARRAGLDLTNVRPKRLDDVVARPTLVVTVCDRAHEEIQPAPAWLHWSLSDPVATPNRATFDATVAELRARITGLAAAAS